MATGFEIDGIDLDNLYALIGEFGITRAVPFTRYPNLHNKFVKRDTEAYIEGAAYMRGIGISERYTNEGVDFDDILCNANFRPYTTYRWKAGGVEAGGANSFYIWKPDADTIRISNTSGNEIISFDSKSEMIFFRMSATGGGGGHSDWIYDGSGGAGGSVGLGWTRLPIVSDYKLGVYVYTSDYSEGAGGASSTITGYTGTTWKCYRGGEASGGSPGESGTKDADTLHADFSVWGAVGGRGANHGHPSGSCGISKYMYHSSSGYFTISGSGNDMGSGSAGAGGGSIGKGGGYNNPAVDGSGGVGARNGIGNGSTWKYGASGSFFLYF